MILGLLGQLFKPIQMKIFWTLSDPFWGPRGPIFGPKWAILGSFTIRGEKSHEKILLVHGCTTSYKVAQLCKRLYKTVHPCTRFYNHAQGFTRFKTDLYKLRHNLTWLYILQRLCENAQGCTMLYKVVLGTTRLSEVYKIVQGCIRL